MPLFVIDYLKLKVINTHLINFFRSHDWLYFNSNSERLILETAEIQSKDYKMYNGILFEFTEYFLYIHFKPHYYFNNNLHNANDFSAIQCIKTLNSFIDDFGINPNDLKIINIEFGLNIIIPTELILIEDLLSVLYSHGKNGFYTDRKFPFCKFSSSIGLNGKANVFLIIKAYAKGIQFPEYTHRNTLRFEVKSNRKEKVNKLGIYTLNDLLQFDTYKHLSNEIIKEFNKVLIIDEYAKPVISKRRLTTHNERLKERYWSKLFYKSRNVFLNNFKSYYDDLNTCKTHLKKEIENLIKSKLSELLNCAYLNLHIDEMRTVSKKQCIVTGLNISMQKVDSILLSHTGLRYYYKTDKKIFNEVKNKYLSKLWIDADHETQILKIAHNIRCKSSNTMTSRKQKYNPLQMELF